MERSLIRPTNIKQNTNLRRSNALPPIRQPQYIKMNVQRRKKLGQSLTQSMILKFNDNSQKEMIEKEVNDFLQKENLTEKDLKKLEIKISKKIKQKKEKEELSKNLILSTKPKIIETKEETKPVENANPNLIVQEKIENKKQDLNTSGMSGGSDLDKFDGKYAKEEMDAQELKDLEKYKNESNEPAVKKVVIDSSKYNDEWDAINMYQKRMAEERDRLEKTKEREMKMRNRADLLNQMQQKIKRKNEEELKDKEYAKIIEQSVKKMDELEKKQKEIKKQQILKEKEIRDKQLRDIYVAKRIAFLKNKKYEKELVEHNKEEIRLEKEAIQAKKKKYHEELLKTLKDNELHKQKLIEQEKKEKENDVQMMEDALAAELKKDYERKTYFENIKKAGAQFSDEAVRNVYRLRDEKLKDEEEKMKQYLYMTNKMADEADMKRKMKERENKKMMKEFYDKQVKEKKAKEEYEHQIDLAQGRIWNQDYLNYIEKEKETNRKVRELAKKNLVALDAQVKMGKYDVDKVMSAAEREMNMEILRQASEM